MRSEITELLKLLSRELEQLEGEEQLTTTVNAKITKPRSTNDLSIDDPERIFCLRDLGLPGISFYNKDSDIMKVGNMVNDNIIDCWARHLIKCSGCSEKLCCIDATLIVSYEMSNFISDIAEALRNELSNEKIGLFQSMAQTFIGN